jgi:hypothetical protein
MKQFKSGDFKKSRASLTLTYTELCLSKLTGSTNRSLILIKVQIGLSQQQTSKESILWTNNTNSSFTV